MIYITPFEYSIKNDNLNIHQEINPETGKSFNSYDEVCEDILKFYESEEIVEELLNFFKNENLEIPNVLSNKLLNELKEEKINEIKAEKQKAQDKGVFFKGYHFQMDADGKANILGIRVALQDGTYKKLPVKFKTFENIYIELSKEEYLEMSNKALDFVYECLQKKENLIQKINEAKTIDELNKIKWV